MTNIKQTQRKQLSERLEQNYEQFKNAALQLSGKEIFDLAPKIAAVNDVFFYMTTHDWASDGETEYLLYFENPLKLLADVWEEESDDRGSDFGNMLTKMANEDFTEAYITVTLADELRDKYGDDIPLDEAIICEIIELGRKLFKY
jgi:hypothetical protein